MCSNFNIDNKNPAGANHASPGTAKYYWGLPVHKAEVDKWRGILEGLFRDQVGDLFGRINLQVLYS
jgi:hypothetical protein